MRSPPSPQRDLARYRLSGGKGYDIAYGAVVDAVGVLVVGWLAPPARFGALTLASSDLGQSTGFVARIGTQALATRGAMSLTAETVVAAPNPASGQTVLQIPAAGQARTLLLLDAAGREVARQLVPPMATSALLPVTGLPAGLYLVRCEQLPTRLLVEWGPQASGANRSFLREESCLLGVALIVGQRITVRRWTEESAASGKQFAKGSPK